MNPLRSGSCQGLLDLMSCQLCIHDASAVGANKVNTMANAHNV